MCFHLATRWCQREQGWVDDDDDDVVVAVRETEKIIIFSSGGCKFVSVTDS